MAFSAPILVGTTGNTATTTSLTTVITQTADIPNGALVILVGGMDTTSAHTIGITSAVPSVGSMTWNMEKAGANRASTIAEHLWSGPATSLFPSGTTWTITTPSNHAKRGYLLAYIIDQDPDTPDVNTGEAWPVDAIGSVTYGDTGTTTVNVPISATSANGAMLIGSLGLSGTGVLAPSGGWTTLAEARTTTGTSDRGVALVYLIQATAGTAAVTGSLPSGAWAGSAQAFTPAAPTTAAVYYCVDGTTVVPCEVYYCIDATTVVRVDII